MHFLVFLGSVRDTSPPKPKRLGERVARRTAEAIRGEGHDATLIDPLAIEWPRPFKPHFAYAAGRAPEDIEALARTIEGADGFAMVSPEYNHSMSPALADMLNHFGSSLFSYKPSAIVTYSAGQWGGARAAVAMRAFLAELGCLPVSAMIHVPHAQNVFDEAGEPLPDVDGERWADYFGRTVQQLIWWANAARRERDDAEVTKPGAFRAQPSQRNAPPSRQD